MASNSRLLLAAVAWLTACSLDTHNELDQPIVYSVHGLFDSARYQVTVVGVNDTLQVNDSLRGQLIIYNLYAVPRASLAVAKCGLTCYGYANAATPFNVGTLRSGDSVSFYVFFDSDRRIQFEGRDMGDSIVGGMNSWRFRPGGEPIYHGRFVARRSPQAF